MNKQTLLDLIGPAFLCHEINCKPIEQIASDLADNIMKAYEQPDISEDAENQFELLLLVKNELLKADKLPFAERVEASRDILNFVSIKRKQEVEPIPTVDEDELWMRIAEIIVGYNIGKKNTTTKHALNNRIDILKKQFSITRK